MSEENMLGSSFGTLLKSARQEKSLSLEEVCSDLKINLRLLRNLEDSNIEELPKRAFTRGLIKSYAKYLKVAHEDILNLYDANFESNSHIVKTGVLKKSTNQETVFISDVFQKTVLPVVILFLTVAGVLAIAIFLKSYNPVSTFNQIADNSTKAEIADAPDTSNALTTKNDTLSNENDDKTPEQEEANTVSKINMLVMEPLDKTIITIKTNLDEKPVRAYLKPNKTRVFRFESAEIKFFDAGAVNLLFNGKSIGVPGNFGEQKVVRYPAESTR